eukprot:115978-Rhodomonas_salina.1
MTHKWQQYRLFGSSSARGRGAHRARQSRPPRSRLEQHTLAQYRTPPRTVVALLSIAHCLGQR